MTMLKKKKTIHKKKTHHPKRLKTKGPLFSIPVSTPVSTYAYMKSLLLSIDAYVGGQGGKLFFASLLGNKLCLLYGLNGFSLTQEIIRLKGAQGKAYLIQTLPTSGPDVPGTYRSSLDTYSFFYTTICNAIDYIQLFDEAISLFGTSTGPRISFGCYLRAGFNFGFGPSHGEFTDADHHWHYIGGAYVSGSAENNSTAVNNFVMSDHNIDNIDNPIPDVTSNDVPGFNAVHSLGIKESYGPELAGDGWIPAWSYVFKGCSVVDMTAMLAVTYNGNGELNPWRFTNLGAY